jgi:hypothetical protein
MPDGLTDIDSWIEPTFERCFQLMECDDARLLQQWIVHWLGVTPQMAARFRAYHEVAGHGADFCAIRPPPSRRGSPAEEIAQSTVAKYMIKRPRRPGQGGTTFLRNHADGIAAADLFVVPTIGF